MKKIFICLLFSWVALGQNQYLQAQTPTRGKRDTLLQKNASLKRTSEREYLDDMNYYYENRRMDKIETLAREWYESGLYSSNLLFYCYNELVGLKEHAVLVSDMNLGTFYRYLLQYGVGLFKDVEIVDPSDMVLNVSGENRPVYFTQLLGNKSLLDSLKENLYSEGLVFRYSSKPYNNIAVLRKNFEQNYLLDYVRQPLLNYGSYLSDEVRIRTNYLVGFSSLLQFYKVSGDKNQYQRLRKLLQGILDGFGIDQSPVSSHDKQSVTLKKQLQNLIEPEVP